MRPISLALASALAGVFVFVAELHQGAKSAPAPPSNPDALDAFGPLPSSAFRSNPYTVYELRENAELRVRDQPPIRINDQGFRGVIWPPATDRAAMRVVVFGGARTFGLGCADSETLPERLRRALAQHGAALVANVAVPGYTSHETANAFALRRLDLRPDVIVLTDLDDEVTPLLTRGFTSDYSHYWRIWIEGKGGAGDGSPLAWRVLQPMLREPAKVRAPFAEENLRPFEENLHFISGVARGRGIACIAVLPDPKRNIADDEQRATAAIRTRTEAAAKAYNFSVVDGALPDGAAPSPAAYADRAAAAVAAEVLRLRTEKK